MKKPHTILEGRIEFIGRTEAKRAVYYFPELNKYWVLPAYLYIACTNHARTSNSLYFDTTYQSKTNGIPRITAAFGNVEKITTQELWDQLQLKFIPIFTKYGCFNKRCVLRSGSKKYGIEDTKNPDKVVVTAYSQPNVYVGRVDRTNTEVIKEYVKKAIEIYDEYARNVLYVGNRLPVDEAFVLLDKPPVLEKL